MKFARAAMLLMTLALAGPSDCKAQEVTTKLTTDPDRAPLVYDDVVNFIRVHKMLAGANDTMAILQTEYLDKGTPGLQMYIEKYDLTAERLLKAIRRHSEKYADLGGHPAAIEDIRDQAQAAFAKLKGHMPHVQFPPTYFLVGGYRGIGSGSVEGQLISVEKWEFPFDHKMTMLIHELTHFQQVLAVGYEKYKRLFDPEKSLLGLCIREGTAEFFADLVTGTITQDEAIAFLDQNDARLWKEFVPVMHGRETGDWMWSTPKDSLQPRHVGYVLGARIVAAYYEQTSDKTQAVKEILGVTDYTGFLEKSGYGTQFED